MQAKRDRAVRETISRNSRFKVPAYNFAMERLVMNTSMIQLLHNGKSSSSESQQPSNDFWTASLNSERH